MILSTHLNKKNVGKHSLKISLKVDKMFKNDTQRNNIH